MSIYDPFEWIFLATIVLVAVWLRGSDRFHVYLQAKGVARHDCNQIDRSITITLIVLLLGSYNLADFLH